jgi:hypothetical protein
LNQLTLQDVLENESEENCFLLEKFSNKFSAPQAFYEALEFTYKMAKDLELMPLLDQLTVQRIFADQQDELYQL